LFLDQVIEIWPDRRKRFGQFPAVLDGVHSEVQRRHAGAAKPADYTSSESELRLQLRRGAGERIISAAMLDRRTGNSCRLS
jgi:hypothetical protein